MAIAGLEQVGGRPVAHRLVARQLLLVGFDVAFVTRFDVEYPTMYAREQQSEQQSILEMQAIEIIERRRTQADPLFGPLKAETGVRFP